MPVVRMQPRNSEMVLVREGRDEAGRDEQQIWAMEQNTVKPPRLTGVNKLYAEQVAAENAVYPKVMYKVALKRKKGPDGKPDLSADPVASGDRINPNYPMPYALAVENGFHGQITGQGSDKGINIVYPYRTCFVPIDWNQNFPTTVDEVQCKKEQAKLEKDGWVDDPNKLILPKREMDDDYVEMN